MRSRKPRYRSPRYPRHWPLGIAWALGLILSVWLVGALAYVIGRRQPEEPTAVPEAVLAAAARPGTALATACVALVLGAWCLRHLCLNWLAWRPGRIEVAEFAAGSRLGDADVKQMTLTFRRMLATLQLQAPAPVPGAAPEGDFLDVLSRGGSDARNVLATLINLLRAAAPTHAYELHGVLREREQRPRYGVTVQVLRLPNEGSLPMEAWGETWDAALRRAADEATAAILPRTRRCRAPWAAWRGRAMPPGLVHAYEEATRHEQERRYDEALHEYYAAAELDPMNMVLRLRIGQLQERLGLYLDALSMYCGMLEAARPAGHRLPLRLYRGPARRERRRALLAARYRRNVLLSGRALADEWSALPGENGPTKRDEQRVHLRRCLRRHLTDTLEAFVVREWRRARRRELLRFEQPSGPRAKDREAKASDRVSLALADALPAEPANSARYLELRDLLTRYAAHDCRCLRRRQTRRRRDRRTTLTPSTIALTEVCIDVRRGWITQARKVGQSGAPAANWAGTADEVVDKIRRVELGPARWLPLPFLRGSFRSWHEHYNAACALAVPLIDPDLDIKLRDKLARLAVRRLEQATARADSAYIASRRDWLLSEDPDLAGLRTTDEFKNFEVMYLPASDVTPRRPVRVREVEGSRYVCRLLSQTAERWQDEWHRRGSAPPPDISVALRWYQDELTMWKEVLGLARHFGHSGTRLKLIERMRDRAEEYRFSPLTVALDRYEAKPLPEDAGSCDTAAEDEIARVDAALAGIAHALDANAHGWSHRTLLADLQRCETTLHELLTTARPPSPYLLAALCDRHAAMWHLLAQWLAVDADGTEAAERRFSRNAAQACSLWCAKMTWWRPLSAAHSSEPPLGRVPTVRQVGYQLHSWSLRRSAASGRRASAADRHPASRADIPLG